jgi:hypothetical protein
MKTDYFIGGHFAAGKRLRKTVAPQFLTHGRKKVHPEGVGERFIDRQDGG